MMVDGVWDLLKTAGRLKGVQVTPLVSQGERFIEAHFTAIDYAADIDSIINDLEDIEKPSDYELDSLDLIKSYESDLYSDYGKEIRSLKKEIKELDEDEGIPSAERETEIKRIKDIIGGLEEERQSQARDFLLEFHMKQLEMQKED